MRALPRTVLCALLIVTAFRTPLHALGEGSDPRALEAKNLEINALHAELSAATGSVQLIERLVAAYNDRVHLLDGNDPEGLLSVDRLADELLALDPGNVMALVHLADALLSKGRHDDAYARAKKAVERAPNDPRVCLILARLAFQFLDFKESVRAAVVAAAANDPRVAEAGASLLVLARKFGDEHARLVADCAARPNASGPRLEAARFLLRKELSERPENAKRAFAEVEELVKKNPEFAEGMIFLSELSLQVFEDAGRAEKYARQAMKIASSADLSRMAAKALNEAAMKRMTGPKKGRGK